MIVQCHGLYTVSVPRFKTVAQKSQLTRKFNSMEFHSNVLFHIYNRGNNQQKIFFKPDNYVFFLKKVRLYILLHCDIFAYCLLPNHFHFLIHADKRTIATKNISGKKKNVLSEGFKTLLSSYTQAINKQNKTSGSLFQQNTKAKPIIFGSPVYNVICLNYIHQNPLKAKLVKKMEDWPYSSFRDYCEIRKGTLCNKTLAIEMLKINMNTFYNDSYENVITDGSNSF
jgi:REP element-mobilizing transposase RayT